jgi:hypothetical protein
MEVICSSETSVDIKRTTRHYIPEDSSLQDQSVFWKAASGCNLVTMSAMVMNCTDLFVRNRGSENYIISYTVRATCVWARKEREQTICKFRRKEEDSVKILNKHVAAWNGQWHAFVTAVMNLRVPEQGTADPANVSLLNYSVGLLMSEIYTHYSVNYKMVTICTTSLSTEKTEFFPHSVFRIVLTINSDYFPNQH